MLYPGEIVLNGWIPFEKFQNVSYITKGGFDKIYSAEWTEG